MNIFGLFPKFALVEFRTNWIRIKWGPGVIIIIEAHSFMVFWVVKYSSGGYKIRKIFAKKSTYPNFFFNFKNWCSEEVLKSDKIWLSKSKSIIYDLCLKSLKFFSIFFIEDANFGAHFLLLTFFDDINFQVSLFSKMMSNSWQVTITSILSFRYVDF